MSVMRFAEEGEVLRLAREGQSTELAALLNALQTREGATQEVLQLGAEAVAIAGNHRGALNILRNLNHKNPKNNRTLKLAGACFEALGDYVNARRAFHEASNADPTDDYSLAHAANMYLQTNEFEQAYTLTKRLERRKPNAQQLFELRLVQATCLLHLGDTQAAEQTVNLLDELQRQDALVHSLMGRVWLSRGDLEKGLSCFVSALNLASERDKPGLERLIRYLKGESSTGLGPEITASIFDSYADKFDRHLVKDLGYGAPLLIADHVHKRFGTQSFNFLDLGCGTGLVAEALKPLNANGVGVDISKKMLLKAEKKQIYSHLLYGDIPAVLKNLNEESFDLVIAADVFSYLGDLNDIIKRIFAILRGDGMLCFTIEIDDQNPDSTSTATSSMRSRHGARAVNQSLAEGGFKNVASYPFVMRYEAGTPVDASIVVAFK
ncbi:MAG: methyltransferase domain-containing protein [Casimicrobium sp.]